MLKLRLQKGDKVLIGDDIIMEVISSSDLQAVVDFNAPREVEITTIHKDITKQFRNRLRRPL